MSELLNELKRRNVVRVGIAYVLIAWVIAQVAELALDSFEAPGWVIKAVLLLLALGKPKETVVLDVLGPEGDIKYWRDDDGVHHVPKRALDDVIVRPGGRGPRLESLQVTLSVERQPRSGVSEPGGCRAVDPDDPGGLHQEIR